MLSFWEKKSTVLSQELVVIGGGIVGCNAAISYLEMRPGSRVMVLDGGVLPNGASTKNAGFACFGSVSELLDDLNVMSDEEVIALVESRWQGLAMLKKRVRHSDMDYKQYGGHEVFQDIKEYERCLPQISRINELLRPCFGQDVFSVSPGLKERFGIQSQGELISNRFEGQLNPMAMMLSLRSMAETMGAEFYTGAEVQEVNDGEIQLNNGMHIHSERVVVATNGFASRLLSLEVKPARAQVLITAPIKDLAFKGVFHLDRGYYYFRNVGDRVLFGGGRNLDFVGEETMNIETTDLIQDELERLLREVIIPNRSVEVEHRWAGIMGLGKTRSPLIERISERLFCAVRLGGMGVALGSLVGDKVAKAVCDSL